MKMDELREAFAAWKIGEPLTNAYDLMQLLTDPTPITEAGLRELGVKFERTKRRGDWLVHTSWGIVNISDIKIKTMGRLRMLLLSVGE